MFIHIQALLFSSCVSFSRSLSSSLLPGLSLSLVSTSRLRLSVCKQISAHVIRCLHQLCFHRPLLPPSLLACLPPPLPLGCLSFSFHTQPPPSFAAASYYWSSCRADGRQADVGTGMRGGYDMIVLMACCCLHSQLSFWLCWKITAQTDAELWSAYSKALLPTAQSRATAPFGPGLPGWSLCGSYFVAVQLITNMFTNPVITS